MSEVSSWIIDSGVSRIRIKRGSILSLSLVVNQEMDDLSSVQPVRKAGEGSSGVQEGAPISPASSTASS